MDKLLALRAFVDVAETGGFSKTARRMGVATSSVTRLIDALELSLGSALLTRTTRQVTLTDAGMTYLEQVNRVLFDLEEADSSVADTKEQAVGPLRISMPVTFGRKCLGPHIASFLEENPRVSLDLLLSDEYIDLASERIDIAVRIGSPINQPNLIVKHLADHQRYVVASPRYLDRYGMPKIPEDISKHESLCFAYQTRDQQWSFTQSDETKHIKLHGRLSINNSDVLRDAVLSGFGIALLPSWLVHEDVVKGSLFRLFEDYSVNPIDQNICIYAAYLPNRRHSRKVQAFLSFLKHHISMSNLLAVTQ